MRPKKKTDRAEIADQSDCGMIMVYLIINCIIFCFWFDFSLHYVFVHDL